MGEGTCVLMSAYNWTTLGVDEENMEAFSSGMMSGLTWFRYAMRGLVLAVVVAGILLSEAMIPTAVPVFSACGDIIASLLGCSGSTYVGRIDISDISWTIIVQ